MTRFEAFIEGRKIAYNHNRTYEELPENGDLNRFGSNRNLKQQAIKNLTTLFYRIIFNSMISSKCT